MRAYEYQQAVDEAAMNPSAFAAAVAQGTEQGVLVGFEFEVCVPEATFSGSTGGAETVGDYIKRHKGEMFDLTMVWERPFKTFSDVFKFRDTSIPYRNLDEARRAMFRELVPQLVAVYEQIPEKVLKKYRDDSLARVKQRSGSRGWSRMSAVEKQINFAKHLGTEIYYKTRGTTSQLGEQLRKMADTGDDVADILVWIFKSSNGIEPIANRFDELFDYDPQQAWEYFKTIDWDSYDDEDEYPGFDKAAQILQGAVQNTFNRKTTVFTSYHQKKKNLTDWYVEPDGSIDPDEDSDDAAAEVVSPPYPAAEAMSVLNAFYGLAGQLKLYTNETTGLHINVSIPQKIDVLKLAVFLGDQYVLKYFGREHNDYAQSVMQGLKGELENSLFRGTKNGLAVIQAVANDLSGSHSASISNNGKYISFRHAGGNYLGDLQGVSNTVGRFVNAMLIAADPTAYRNEYFAKLYKLFPGREQGAGIGDPAEVLARVRKIRQEGLPVTIVDVAYTDVAQVPTRQFVARKPLVAREVGSPAAKNVLIPMAGGKVLDELRKLPAAQFCREIYTPPLTDRDINGVPGKLYRQSNGRTSMLYALNWTTLPATDPTVVAYLKKLVKPLLAQKKKKR